MSLAFGLTSTWLRPVPFREEQSCMWAYGGLARSMAAACSTREDNRMALRAEASGRGVDCRYEGRVFGPPSMQEEWWDARCFSGAVVVPPLRQAAGDHLNGKEDMDGAIEQLADSQWRMYYYGRDGDSWSKGVVPPGPIPTGRIGLATSEDGIKWKRFRGPLKNGAIMDPSEDVEAFDSVQIAVSDVVRITEENKPDRWGMFYLGAGLEDGEVPGMKGTFKGVRIRPGFAESSDGINYTRPSEPLLQLGMPGDFDELGIAWARVVPPGGRGPLSRSWLMTYHTRERGSELEIPSFSVGLALSDDGLKWKKHGKVLSRGASGSWDDGGVSVRHVLRIGDKFVMFYEGSDIMFNFGIGLATSVDGIVWERATGVGEQPGGPILKSRKGEDVWDNEIVATPYVVAMPDESFRMYYLGVGKLQGDVVPQQGIGLVVSDGSDYTKWKRCGS